MGINQAFHTFSCSIYLLIIIIFFLHSQELSCMCKGSLQIYIYQLPLHLLTGRMLLKCFAETLVLSDPLKRLCKAAVVCLQGCGGHKPPVQTNKQPKKTLELQQSLGNGGKHYCYFVATQSGPRVEQKVQKRQKQQETRLFRLQLQPIW